LTGNPSSKKVYYDLASFFGTQVTFAFVVSPFLILSFTESIRTWARVYFYALIWTVGILIFFNSPGKAWLSKQLEKRQGRASARLARTVSSDSLAGGQPILGISKDPERDINEAIEEFKAEIEAQQKKKA
jgi:lysophospholipid acyltransferase